tara:strand:- start:2990 stop:3271 length:282 start_codon:yes stop_codon:yes gene_type:complete
MTNLLKHRELIEEFFDKAQELSHLAETIHILTDEMDFAAMDVLINLLMSTMVEGDLEELTRAMADFAVRNSKKGKQDAISDLIDATQIQRGIN